MKCRVFPLLMAVSLLSGLFARSARADMDEIELRKTRKSAVKLGFAFIGLYETAFGLNRDRNEGSSFFYLAPQLKIGDKMRARLNFGFIENYLIRQDNPWDFMDMQLQFSHLGFYKEKYTGIDLSGHLRYYIPISIDSRNQGSYGQARGTVKASRSWGKLFANFEFNLQKYFHRYTTWNTTEDKPGTVEWKRGGFKEDYIENNASFGFGETFTLGYSPLPTLDLSAMFGLMQARQYPAPEPAAGEPIYSRSGGARMTRWVYGKRLILDATLNLSILPWGKGTYWKDKVLDRLFVSVGYQNLSPNNYPNGSRHYNVFDPKYAQAYIDLMILY